MDELCYELYLMRLDIGSVKKCRLTDCLGGAKEVYMSDKKTLLSTNIITEEDVDKIIEEKNKLDLERIYDDFIKSKQKLVTRRMDNFPKALRDIPSAPYGLFYIGDLPASFDKCVSIVGARRCSEYGRYAAQELAKKLSELGYIIVSGLALGIDNAAHIGALEKSGVSIAVLGCGVDICYPRSNIDTYTKLLKKGAIVSEYYPATKPVSYNFPIRNRIISALSNQVVIIEAREKSGSLITADFAMEQGKDIYALPGRINDALSYGCNRLIEQGAGIITSVKDFISNIERLDYNTIMPSCETTKSNVIIEKEDRAVYECLDYYPKDIESVCEESKLDLMRVLASIVNLCDLGFAKEVFVNQYVKIR